MVSPADLEMLGRSDREIAFGTFRLIPARQQLLDGSRQVRLGSRALAILTTLVERSGDLVTKDELLARVWPGVIVDEANLRVHISALRKALGDGVNGKQYLANVSGRGYRFVAPVAVDEGATAPVAPPVAPVVNLPVQLVRVVGRDDMLKHLTAGLDHDRLVTIVGPGGIGKTTAALSAAQEVSPRYRNGVCFVDLAPLADSMLVPSAAAAALGFPDPSGDVVRAIAARLKDSEQLIIFDSCEHVIHAVATLVEEILRAAPRVRILATSREPLRAEGERVHRISPLNFPVNSPGLTASAALSYSAIRLFVERATASLDTFEFSDGNAPVVAEICKKLDGLALAIELAAGRIDTLGVQEINALLDNRLRALTRARRTALPRHRTLLATLDWSHDLLSESERVLFRRLAIFAGWFDVGAVLFVTSDEVIPADLTDLANLVAKSLVAADISGVSTYYRLLDTTRVYALEKLAMAGEADATARRHLEYYRDLLERIEGDSASKPTPVVGVEYSRQLDNVRVALDWAFGPRGDPALALALTAAAVPLWKFLSLMKESRDRVDQALSLRGKDGEGNRRDMQLFAALSGGLLMTTADSGPQIRDASARTLEIAERLGDIDYQLAALWSLWLGGRLPPLSSLPVAEQFRALAESAHRPDDAAIGDRMAGVSLLLMGRLSEARPLVERAVAAHGLRSSNTDIRRFQFDQSVIARSQLSQILWLQGFPDQAMHSAQTAVDHALSIDHSLSVCEALAQTTIPLALLRGDIVAADRFLTMLLDRAEREELSMWIDWGHCYGGLMRALTGDAGEGAIILRAALAAQGSDGFVRRRLGLLGALAGIEGHVGHVQDGLATIEEALKLSEQSEESWCTAELLRVKGGLLLAQSGPDAAVQAEEHWYRSMEVAREQGALSWRLRAAISIATMCDVDGRHGEGRDVLAPVFAKFTEGFGTRDFLRARDLLDGLS